MLGQRPHVILGAELMQQLGRTFDVRDEEGDGARRQAAHPSGASRFLHLKARSVYACPEGATR
jgi:hypothetical protein